VLPALKVGGLYAARVLGTVASGRVSIELGGETLTARAEAPVRAGQRVVVEVESLVPTVVLKIAPERQEVPLARK
jgi:membrane protein implicated in regulation of membrane protease activity